MTQIFSVYWSNSGFHSSNYSSISIFTSQQENSLLLTLHNLSGDLVFKVPTHSFFFPSYCKEKYPILGNTCLRQTVMEKYRDKKRPLARGLPRDCPAYAWLPLAQRWLPCVKSQTTMQIKHRLHHAEPPSPWSHPQSCLALVTEKNGLFCVLEIETRVFQTATEEPAGHCTLHPARPPDSLPC